MSWRLAPIAVAFFAAAPAQAETRLELGPERVATLEHPLPQQPGVTISSEITEADTIAGAWRAEHFLFTGKAGDVLTLNVKSEIPELLVTVLHRSDTGKYAMEFRGPARGAPMQVSLKKDGTHLLIIGAIKRSGRYELDFQSSAVPPPATVQVAAAPPTPTVVARSTPAATPPLARPELPPTPGVLTLVAGQSTTRPAGKAGAGVETFQFLAGAGADLSVSVAAAGRVSIALYTPEGDEMRAAGGVGSVKLDAVLPVDAIYFIAVSREDAAKPYTLSLAAPQPDTVTAAMRFGVGYEALGSDGQTSSWSCWVEPGVRARHTVGTGAKTQILFHTDLGGGRMRWDWTDGNAYTVVWTGRVENDAVVMMSADGAQASRITFDAGPRRYRGYLCP